MTQAGDYTITLSQKFPFNPDDTVLGQTLYLCPEHFTVKQGVAVFTIIE